MELSKKKNFRRYENSRDVKTLKERLVHEQLYSILEIKKSHIIKSHPVCMGI